jgi:hypothetical protein
MDFDFFTLNATETVKNTHLIDDAFTSIAVDTSDCDVNLIPAEGDVCRVECIEAENRMHQVAVKNGTLCITEIDTRQWYDHIGFGLFKPLEISIYLPVAVYESLSVHTNTGDFSVTAGSFSKLKADTDTGDIALRNVSVGGYTSGVSTNCPLEITTDTGDVSIYDCYGDIITVETDTGDVNLKNLTAGGLSVTCNTGAISLTEADAISNVILETDTGDVEINECRTFTLSVATHTGGVEIVDCTPNSLSVSTTTGDVGFLVSVLVSTT